MDYLPQLSLMFGIWIAGLIVFSVGTYKARKKRNEADNDVVLASQNLSNVVPWYYPVWNYLSAVLLIVCTILFAYYLPVSLLALQQRIYSHGALVVLAPDALFVNLLIFAGFLGLAVFGAILTWLFGVSPNFSRYQRARKVLLAEAWRNHLISRWGNRHKAELKVLWERIYAETPIRQKTTDWFSIYLLMLIMWIWTLPFLIFGVDNYYKVTNDAFVVNAYLSLGEKRYSFNQVQQVDISGKIVQTYSKSETTPKYQLDPNVSVTTRDGKTRALWESFGGPGRPKTDDLVRFLKGLRAGGVPFIYKPLNAEQIQFLAGYGKDSQAQWGSVAEYAQSVVASTQAPAVGNSHAQSGPGFRTR